MRSGGDDMKERIIKLIEQIEDPCYIIDDIAVCSINWRLSVKA